MILIGRRAEQGQKEWQEWFEYYKDGKEIILYKHTDNGNPLCLKIKIKDLKKILKEA